MIGIRYVYRIIVFEDGIKVPDHDVVGTVDLDHVALVIDPIDSTAVAIQDNIVLTGNLDHPVQFRVGKHIVIGDELDVGVTVYDHIIGDRDMDLGKDHGRKDDEDPDL
jgi:hypothetical protein